MLNTSSNSDIHNMLLADREKFPVMVESDNPFIGSQEFDLSTGQQKGLALSSESSMVDLKSIELMNKLTLQQVNNAKIRIARIPSSVALINNLGMSYFNNRDHEKAIKCFEEALSLDSNSFQTLANIAKTYLSMGDTSKALDLYLRIEDKFPSSIKVLNNIANILLRRNEFIRAKDYLERVLKQESNNLAALSNLAMVFLVDKKLSKAINYYRRALLVKPDLPGVLNNLGVCFALQKSFKKAIKHFLAAYALNKRDIGIMTNLARCYLEKGATEEAIRTLENYLQDGEDNRYVREELAYLYFLGKDYKNSLHHLLLGLKQLDPEIKNSKEKTRIVGNISLVYQALEDFEAAEKYYTICLNTKPLLSWLPLYNAINFYFLRGRNTEAKKLIDRGLEEFPEDHHIKETLGRYYFETQNFQKAHEILTDVISIDPKVEDSYALLSVIEMEINKNFEKSNKILNEGLVYHPANEAMLNNLAYNYLLQNDTEKARKILDATIGKDEIFLIATRGLLLIKEGNIQEGQRLYNQAKMIARRKSHPMENLIEQKKNLEVAKYYQGKGDLKEAIRLLKKALSIKAKYDYFRDEAEQIIINLQEKEMGTDKVD